MNIAFYQLLTTPLEKTLPKLLEKIYASNQKALVLAESQERLDQLDSVLWTYSTNAFLPHGTSKLPQEFHGRQPIWLTTSVSDNPNSASVLVVTSSEKIETFQKFERILDLFDGNNPTFLEQAQKRMAYYKGLGHTVTLWKQTPQSSWVEEAP